jgi:hypothetical protein
MILYALMTCIMLHADESGALAWVWNSGPLACAHNPNQATNKKSRSKSH